MASIMITTKDVKDTKKMAAGKRRDKSATEPRRHRAASRELGGMMARLSSINDLRVLRGLLFCERDHRATVSMLRGSVALWRIPSVPRCLRGPGAAGLALFDDPSGRLEAARVRVGGGARNFF